jgi:DedD protein
MSNHNRDQELASFRSLLTRGLPDPQAIIYTSARPAGPVDRSLWERSPDLDGFRSIAQAIRSHAREQEGSVVLVTDTEEDASARAYVAARAARLLAEEGLRILLVETTARDGGFLGAAYSEEQEGFVDLVLYGVSPQVACRPTPVSGIHLMTPGSFPPDPGELFHSPEIDARLDQLKAPYDAVLMLATAFPEGDAPNPLLVHVDGLILACRPQASGRLQLLVQALPEQRASVWGAVVFTSPSETVELAVDDALDEREWTAVPDAAPQAEAEPVVRRKTSSSSLFRLGTIAVAVVLLGFVGWWGWMQRTQSGSSSPAPASSGPSIASPRLAAQPPGADSTQVQAAASGATGAQSNATQAPSADATETAPASAATPSPATTAAATPQTPLRADAEELPPPTAGASPKNDVEFKEPGEPEPVHREAPADARIRKALTLTPGGGYAIHLWSFSDSLEAVGALATLRKDGYDPAIVTATIPKKGTWYRVVVGRFASKEDAKEAQSLLMKRPDVDWAGIIRVP